MSVVNNYNTTNNFNFNGTTNVGSIGQNPPDVVTAPVDAPDVIPENLDQRAQTSKSKLELELETDENMVSNNVGDVKPDAAA